MCLAVAFDADNKLPQPLVAEEDIHVIKFLESFYSDDDEWYRSPYRWWVYELDVVHHSELKVYMVPEIEEPFNGTQAKVSEGLHTFGSVGDFEVMNRQFGLGGTRSKLFKAIIPKGAKYYVGSFEGTPNCYASSELLVTSEEVARN